MTQELLKRLADVESQLASLSSAAEATLTAVDRGEGLDAAVHRLRKAWGGSGNARFGPEGCIAAGLRWHEEVGRPPKVEDWHPKMAMDRGRPEAAELFYAGDWPHYSLVRYHFANWKLFMQACGFEPRTRPDAPNTIGMDVDRWPSWNGWEWLAGHRSSKGLSQARLARLSGVSTNYVGDIENGKQTNPTVRVLLAISKALGVPPGALIE